jgi:hypothetical protein
METAVPPCGQHRKPDNTGSLPEGMATLISAMIDF